jgi:cobyrinic acid a,c-diamide synthase
MPLRVHRDALSIPRVLVAGLRGGSGKTLVSLGLVAAWKSTGVIVAPFKKGPDYIDAAWLTRAAGAACRNLDLFLMSPNAVLRSMAESVAYAQVAVIEGNRGLFDGMDTEGSCSTAELAKLLDAPVLLTVDCTKATRTVAALVLGCQRMDPAVRISGVVLNRIGGARHERIVRSSIERSCGIPVVGAIPKLPGELFPERHLGLVPPQESADIATPIAAAAAAAEKHLDLQAMLQIARDAPSVPTEQHPAELDDREKVDTAIPGAKAKIGIFRDSAFQFYYPENIEALVAAGAEIIAVSPIRDRELPYIDALYIGGGFPETLATQLADNVTFRWHLARAIAGGLPVYAECGGAVYLGERLVFDDDEYPMVGALPVTYAFDEKPRGHGYVELEAVGDNPFYAVGDKLRGHEFHYTYPLTGSMRGVKFAFRVRRGYGFDGQHDGVCRHNILALYTHMHALGVPAWAPSLVRAALRFGNARRLHDGALELGGVPAATPRSARP